MTRLQSVSGAALIAIGVLSYGAPAQAGLIAYYTFEGNANDVTGNGFDGSFSAVAPTLTASGFQGSAYQFGSGGSNTFVRIPLDINPLPLPQVTFGAWVNADVADAVIRGIISHDTGDFDRTLDVQPAEVASVGAFSWAGAALAMAAWFLESGRSSPRATMRQRASLVHRQQPHVRPVWRCAAGPG